MSDIPRVLLVGRPNVGKSTLFNRLTRTRAALVDDRDGVTRDWIERPWDVTGDGDPDVLLRDLCGFREHEDDPVLHASQQVMAGHWQDADVILFVVDGRAGATEADKWLAGKVRQAGRPVVLVANKVDTLELEATALAVSELGWAPVFTSAEHAMGIAELSDAILELLPGPALFGAGDPGAERLDVAILGKPNAGKSTLLNTLLGEERATVSDVAGTTRDPVDALGVISDIPVRFVDTAGIRRKRSIEDQLEYASVSRSLKEGRQSNLVMYLIHAEDGITQQDQILLGHVAGDGAAVLLLVSQWDRCDNPEARFKEILLQRDRMLPFLEWAPMISISSVTGHNISRIEYWVSEMVTQMDRTFSTRELNDVIQRILSENPPPAIQIRKSRRKHTRKPLKIYYVTQVGNRPLRIKVFGNLRGMDLPEAYRRFLHRRLREHLDIRHVPLVIKFVPKKSRDQE